MIRFVSKHEAAEAKLLDLLSHVDADWRSIIDADGLKIEWKSSPSFVAGCDLFSRVLTFNPDFLVGSATAATHPIRQQRFALLGLEEEILHYLALRFSFDRSKRWKAAVRQDLSEGNKFRDRLSRYQRRYDRLPGVIKISLDEYAKNIGWAMWFALMLTGRNITAVECVPVVFQARKYLARKLNSVIVDEMMHRAFPECYPAFIDFEKQIAHEAARLRGMPQQALLISYPQVVEELSF